MFLNGTAKVIFFFFTLGVLVSPNVYSDFGQSPLGNIDEGPDSTLQSILDKKAKTSPFLLGNKKLNEVDLEVKGGGPYIDDGKDRDENISITNRDKLFDFGQRVPDGSKESENYKEATNKEIFAQSFNQGTSSFGLSYIKDFGSYKGRSGAFEEIYKNYNESVEVGFLIFSFKYFLKKGAINSSYRINGGLGFYQAPGVFSSTKERSRKNITLWAVPIDFTFDMEMVLGKKFKLELQGGPSIMALFQNRHDKTEEESQKRMGQFGLGGVVGSALKIDMMQFKRMASIDLLSSLSVTDYYLNVEVRYHNYFWGFLDDISVNGLSLGLGISYDFL